MSGDLLLTALWVLLALAAALVVTLATILLVRAFRSRRLGELRPWHADRVGEELRAADYDAAEPLEQLLARERRLLAAVDRRLGRPAAPPLDRYRIGGRRHPGERNLSFLLEAAEPSSGVLLLHGLSDSPYLMRSLGERLHRHGATTLGLRLPGHGTAPGGLLSTRWQDWVAATDYGIERLRRRLDGRPLWLVGFSTGATLSLHHALRAARKGRRAAAGMIFMAPALELPWVARFALWHRTLAWLPYFTKFRWQEVNPEYDPCKYSSFPKRAGAEVYRLIRNVWRQAEALDRSALETLPPILAFQSLADDTVVARGIADLLRRLGRPRDELVLFDLNHSPELAGLVADDPDRAFPGPVLGEGGPPPFRVTLVGNRESGGEALEALSWPAGGAAPGSAADAERRELTERWPRDVFSLSHLALPVAAEDPLYGARSELGAAVPRGERGVLAQPLEDLLRLRWNPFFDYLAGRAEALLAGGSR